MRGYIFLLVLSAFALHSLAQTWKNPLTIPDEWPLYGVGDPYVVKYNGLFYLYCSTRDDMTGIKVWSSKDLVSWSYKGLCATDPITKVAYAPEVIQWGGSFYMYTSPGGNGHYVFKSDSPTGPFTLVTGNIGLSIDGSVFKEDDGSLYFYHASHTGIVGHKANSPTSMGTTVTLSGTNMNGWTEGPSLVKRNGVYYMIYTGNHVISKGYRIDFATSQTGPLSGFVADGNQNPVLLRTEGTHVGLGHGTLFRGPNLDEHFITYHNLAGDYGVGPFRRLNFDRVSFSGERMLVHGPCNTDQQAPLLPNFADYFETADLSATWTLPLQGGWSPSNGSLVFEKPAGQTTAMSLALIQTAPQPNYIAEFNVAQRDQASSLKAGAVFNYTNDQNYGVALFDKATNQLEVSFQSNGTWSTPIVASLPGVSNYTVYHSIRIEREATRFRFFVDDMLKLSIDKGMANGKVGYVSYSDNAKFGFCAFSNHANGSSAFDVAKPIPGKIAAAHYISGGKGVGFNTSATVTNSYRYDEVPLVNSPMGGLAVDAKAGDWFVYRTNVATGTLYNIGVGYKSSNSCKIRIKQAGQYITEAVTLPSTGGSYGLLPIGPAQLAQGNQDLRVEVLEGSAEFTELQFKPAVAVPQRSDLFTTGFGYAWRYADGTWAIADAAAEATGSAKRLMGDDGWSDYSVTVDVKYITGMNGGIMVRANNPALGEANNDPHKGTDFFQGYFVTIEANGVSLGKHNYNYQLLQRAQGTYQTNTWYKLAVTVKGNNIKVFVDNLLVPIIDYTDSKPIMSGKAGLRTHNSTVRFDNFTVTTEPLATPLSVAPVNSTGKLVCYPNPANGRVHFKNEHVFNRVRVQSMSGTVVMDEPLGNDQSADLSRFSSGIYLICLSDGDRHRATGMVVLQD